MTILDLGFYSLALGLMGASFLFLSLKNPVHVLLSFSLIILQISSLMMLLGATLVGLLFALFYTTLMVIFLVFYMVTQNHGGKNIPPLSSRYKGIAFLVAIILGGQILFMLVYKVNYLFLDSPQSLERLDASPHALGEILYGDYPLFVIYLGILFFTGFLGIILMISPKKLKIQKQTSLEKINRDSNSIELRDLKFKPEIEERQIQREV